MSLQPNARDESHDAAQALPVQAEPSAPDHLTHSPLPYTVRLVRSDEDLQRAVQIRHQAYARHLPEFARSLEAVEPTDREPGVYVFLASDKRDGAPLGTIRMQTNVYRPLLLEQSIALPDHLRGCRLAEATRLGVTQSVLGSQIRIALFKSFFHFCVAHGIDWMVIAARAPMDRIYDRLLFKDVIPGAGFIPLRHASDLPHRVMALNIAEGPAQWQQAGHPLYDFFFRTEHLDLEFDIERAAPLPADRQLPPRGAALS